MRGNVEIHTPVRKILEEENYFFNMLLYSTVQQIIRFRVELSKTLFVITACFSCNLKLFFLVFIF